MLMCKSDYLSPVTVVMNVRRTHFLVHLKSFCESLYLIDDIIFFRLTCTATNIHGQSADASVTVKVEGANEFSPEFSKSIYSFETFDRIDSETK